MSAFTPLATFERTCREVCLDRMARAPPRRFPTMRTVAPRPPNAEEDGAKNDDGMIDLAEAKQAASRKFDQLDRKRTGALSRSQVGRLRLTRKEFAAADTDNDGTLTKDEYLAVVEQRFNAADDNHSGTLTLKQFNSKAGLPLRRLTY